MLSPMSSSGLPIAVWPPPQNKLGELFGLSELAVPGSLGDKQAFSKVPASGFGIKSPMSSKPGTLLKCASERGSRNSRSQESPTASHPLPISSSGYHAHYCWNRHGLKECCRH